MHIQRTLTAGAALVLLLLAAGCGSGNEGGGGVPDTGAGADAPGFPDSEGPADVTGGDPDGKPVGDVPEGEDGGGPDVPGGDGDVVAPDDDGSTPPDADGDDDVTAPDAGGDVAATCEEGTGCDDGDPCTGVDRCQADGTCAGTPVVCDDGRECTDDFCDATGTCAASLKGGWCLIDAVCVGSGARPADNACRVCAPAADPARWTDDDGASCDDDDACTTGDRCAGGACAATGAVECPAAEACADHVCDSATGDCVRTPHGGACDDGSACTVDDQCSDGACLGFELTCEDAGPCAAESCEPLVGCVETPVAGACEDGSACTTGDACVDGDCVGGPPPDCDDENECTADSCHPWLGCDHQPVVSPCCADGMLACDDDDPCTRDECDEAGSCTYTPFVGACEDGDACTENDVCDEAGACLGVPVDCDDDNDCTADSCDTYLGCRNIPTPGTCDDGDPCTEADECRGGQCAGTPKSCNDGVDCTRDTCDAEGDCQHALEAGLPCSDDDACTTGDVCDATGACEGAPRTCDDQNPCTDDSCATATGCVFAPNALPCDDGDVCTTDDVCLAGDCVGTPGGCGCNPELALDASKVISFAIGTNGQPGNGLDVDDDPTTCAPPSNCSGGIDNSMAGVAGPANQPLQDAITEGSLVFLFEHRDLRADGEAYEITLLTGDPVDPVGCDFQAQTCDYLVDRSSYDPDTCLPRISFDNATLTPTTFTAGGPGYTFPFDIPISGLDLSITLFNARIVATPTFAGAELVGLTGIIGGAVPKQQLIDAVNAIPDDQFPEGISKEFVLNLLNILITDDIDIDGNGTPDAASIGILFEAIDGNLTGLTD